MGSIEYPKEIVVNDLKRARTLGSWYDAGIVIAVVDKLGREYRMNINTLLKLAKGGSSSKLQVSKARIHHWLEIPKEGGEK
jgi:hypothetical protein